MKPEKRTTKHDLKMKRKSRPYKKGGRFRSINLEEGGKNGKEKL